MVAPDEQKLAAATRAAAQSQFALSREAYRLLRRVHELEERERLLLSALDQRNQVLQSTVLHAESWIAEPFNSADLEVLVALAERIRGLEPVK